MCASKVLPVLIPPITAIRSFRLHTRYSQGVPSGMDDFWKCRRVFPDNHDLYPKISEIQNVTLTVFKDDLATCLNDTLGAKYNFCESTVTLQTSGIDYTLGLHLFPMCRLKKRVSGDLKIYAEDKTMQKYPITLPFDLSSRLLTYIIEGKPVSDPSQFTCVQFAKYLHQVGAYTKENNKVVMKQLTKGETPKSGDMSCLADKSKIAQAVVVHLEDGLDGLCIRHAGCESLRVSTFREACRMAGAVYTQTLRRQP